jgi:hypothetical protein
MSDIEPSYRLWGLPNAQEIGRAHENLEALETMISEQKGTTG